MAQEPAPRQSAPKAEVSRRVDSNSSPPAGVQSLRGRTLRVDPGSISGDARDHAASPLAGPHGKALAGELITSNPSRTRHDLEAFVFRHGQHYDSYLASEPGRSLFWSSGRDGLVSFVKHGRHVFVGGGLIAPPLGRANLLAEFTEFSERRGWRAVFFNVADAELPLFSEFGFQSTKWGEEPIVDLKDRTWRGKQFEWVRRQTNYCLRHGLIAGEVGPEVVDSDEWPAILAELKEVARASLLKKAQSREMRFFEGSIESHELGLRRLFVARGDGGAGRIEGFVVCNPINDGASWSTELYRHRPDSVRGTVAFMFHHMMQALQTEGIDSLALCLDPARNCSTPRPGDSWMVRRGMTFADQYLGVVFDFAGLRHFKSRFRPRYENRFICARPAVSLDALWAFINISGGLRLDLTKLSRAIVERFSKRAQRKTLAGSDQGDPGIHQQNECPHPIDASARISRGD